MWRRPLILASLILCGSIRTVSASAQAPDWTGVWTGTFGTAAAPSEIVLRLEGCQLISSSGSSGWV